MSSNILAVHFKLYGGDGVSLQAQELHRILRQMRWNVFECCCDLPEGKQGLFLPEISYQSKDIKNLRNKIFNHQSKEDEDTLLEVLETKAEKIKDKVEDYLDKNNIKIVHLHNIFSLPFNPAATLAFYNLARKRKDINFISQNHDLISEGREQIFKIPPYYPKIALKINKAILPKLPNVKHTVLNSIAAKEIKKAKGINSVIIPDGFDFEINIKNFSKIKNFRQRFGIDENDLIVGVMTRVLPRKAIEFSIQLVKSLIKKRKVLENKPRGIGPHHRKFNKKSRIILLFSQKEDLKDNQNYYNKLIQYGRKMKVEIINLGDYINPFSYSNFFPSNTYPFYSVYSQIDVFSYPSIQESFGNQLLEGVVLARNLVPVVFEYPVYRSDISSFIPNIVSLGSQYKENPQIKSLKLIDDDVVSCASDQIIYYLLNSEIAQKKAKENYLLAKTQYDIRKIAKKLIKIFLDGKIKN